MTPREERGLVIAALCKLNRTDDGIWLVPSQSKNAEQNCYRVNLEKKTCTSGLSASSQSFISTYNSFVLPC